MGKIFYMMGKSSSGKDTIFKEILKKKELNLHQIVLYTTRPARANETDGVQYHFVDEKRLSELQDAGKVIELRAYQVVGGVWKTMSRQIWIQKIIWQSEHWFPMKNCGIIMGQNELCRFMSRLRTGCVWQGPWIGNAVR